MLRPLPCSAPCRPWPPVPSLRFLSHLPGFPPLFGFVGKLVGFYAVFDQGYAWLGVIGLVLDGLMRRFEGLKIVRWRYAH